MHFYRLITIFIGLFSTTLIWGQILPNTVIQANGSQQVFELYGSDGINGIDGENAVEIPCADFPYRTINGIDGEPGYSGEDGQDGEDLIIRYKNLNDLKNIRISNPGGLGGSGGKGGEGSLGCNGGKPGLDGETGRDGDNGSYGSIYLVSENLEIPPVNPTQLVSLEKLLKNHQKLSFIKWKTRFGLRALLDSSSKVSSKYYVYQNVVEKEVHLKWNSDLPAQEFYETKLGLHLATDGLHLSNYRGPFLNYRVKETPTRSTIIIDRVIREESIGNLSLGKMRQTMFDLTLEVKRKFDLTIQLRNLFNISLFEVREDDNKLSLIGHFKVPEELVEFDVDRFRIYIGKLNYPLQYKQRGVKLKVFLSVTRETESQRRTYVLKGLYRI